MNIDTRIKSILSMKSLAVLILMFWLDRPVGELDAVEYCSLTKKTARKYLKELAQGGFITRAGRYNSWILTTGGSQMLLEMNGTRGNNYLSSGNIYPSNGNIFPTTTTTHILSINKTIEEVRIDAHNEGYILPLEGESLPLNINIDPDLDDALKECGIYGSVRQELACREDLTPEIVRNLCQKLKEEKKHRYSTGLLVHCLRELDEVEVENSDPEEDYRRYAKGKYSELLHF